MNFLNIRETNNIKEKIGIILLNMNFLYKNIINLKHEIIKRAELEHQSFCTKELSKSSKWFCALMDFKRHFVPTGNTKDYSALKTMQKNTANLKKMESAELNWSMASSVLEMDILTLEMCNRTPLEAEKSEFDEDVWLDELAIIEDIEKHVANYCKYTIKLFFALIQLSEEEKKQLMTNLKKKYSLQF